MITISDINAEVAKELGLPLKTVEFVNKNYWQEVRNCIENPEADNVRIEGLGTFYVSPKKTIKKIVSNYYKLRKVEEGVIRSEFKEYYITQFKEYWAIKNKFKFRMTNKKWRWINMEVGYVPYKQYLDKETGGLIQEEYVEDYTIDDTFVEETVIEETPTVIVNLDF